MKFTFILSGAFVQTSKKKIIRTATSKKLKKFRINDFFLMINPLLMIIAKVSKSKIVFIIILTVNPVEELSNVGAKVNKAMYIILKMIVTLIE